MSLTPLLVRHRLCVVLLTAAALLALSAAPLALPPLSAGAQESCPDPEQPVDPADPIIVVRAPQPGDRVTSPVTIEGDAALFEANVIIRIYDGDGNLIADTFTTALDAGPVMAPFSTQVEFAVEAEQPGCVWVTGEPEHVVAVPVTLVSMAEPTPPPAPAPAPTGSAGLTAANGAPLASALLVLGAAVLVAVSRRLAHRSR